MSLIIKFKKTVPITVRIFLLKALICLTCWQLLYQLVLKPHRLLDKETTYITAKTTCGILSLIYSKCLVRVKPLVEIITVNDKPTIRILDGCNALDLFVLHISFLICMPGSKNRKLAFALIGILCIFILNVLRCCGLAWLHFNYPNLVVFAHHYLFTIIVYAFIFLMLIRYTSGIT